MNCTRAGGEGEVVIGDVDVSVDVEAFLLNVYGDLWQRHIATQKVLPASPRDSFLSTPAATALLALLVNV